MREEPSAWLRDDRYRSSFVLGVAVGSLAMWCIALVLNVFEVVQPGPAIAAAIASGATAIVAMATIVHQSRLAAVAAEAEQERSRARVAYECLPELYARARAIHEVASEIAELFREVFYTPKQILISADLGRKIGNIERLPDRALTNVSGSLSSLADPGPRLILSAYRPSDQNFEYAKEQLFLMPTTGGYVYEHDVWQALHSFVLDLLSTLDAIRVLENLNLTYREDFIGEAWELIGFLYRDDEGAFQPARTRAAAEGDREDVARLEIRQAVSNAVGAYYGDVKVFVNTEIGWVNPEDC